MWIAASVKKPTNLKVKWNDLNIFLRRYRYWSIDSLKVHTEPGCQIYRRDMKAYTNTLQGCTDILGQTTTIVWPIGTFGRKFNCCSGNMSLRKEFSLNCRTQKQNEPEPGSFWLKYGKFLWNLPYFSAYNACVIWFFTHNGDERYT